MKIILKDQSKHTQKCSLNGLKNLNFPTDKKWNSFFYEDKWKMLDNESGIYVLWWTGNIKDLLINKVEQFKLAAPHSKKRKVAITVTSQYLEKIRTKQGIPLYVGKTTNLLQRIKHHLRLGLDHRLFIKSGKAKKNHSYSSSQNKFRYKLEALTGNQPKGYSNIISQNICMSYCLIPDTQKQHGGADRFYSELCLILKLKPIFNIDIER